MYSTLLALHSLFRWLVLASLVFAIFRGIQGWRSGWSFSKFDNAVRHNTATIAHVQLLLGIWLYSISPIIQYFLSNFKEAVHQREVRFFGMEHSLMMLSAVVIITIGSIKAKRATTDRQQFKTMAIWYVVALVVLLSSIPWQFSPLVSRPWFRGW
jgi:Mn2+/Fe2+ NRAMP family transporter